MKEEKPPVYCDICLADGKQVIAKADWYDGRKLCLLCLKKV